MVRGRATARGTRRTAAATDRPQPEAGESAAITSEQPAAAGADSTEALPAPRMSVRGGTSARATRGGGTARFRPKAVRREEADRDTLAKQEEKKASDRAAAERKALGRSRFRSKRSRGDAMGSRGGTFGRPITTASGPFASGQAGAGGMKSGGWFGSSGGGGGGGGRPGYKSEGGPGFGVARESREMRINADRLYGVAPDEELNSDDEDMIAALNNREPSLLPMGVFRQKHKEAEVVVRTTAELEAAENATEEAAEESLWVDSGTITPDDKPEVGVWETDSKHPVVVKAEPGDEDAMEIDASIKPAPKKEKTVQFKKTAPRDPEDAVIQQDLDMLARELGAVTMDKEGESITEVANKDGRLYLFQFPPVMPPLKQDGAAPKSKVKDEPSEAAGGDSGMVDLTAEDEAKDNDDDDDSDEEDEKEQMEKKIEKDGFRSQFLSQGGMIGKLNVRKSGKVELVWGGRVMEMSPAASMNFLTTAVIVEESDVKPTNATSTTPGPSGGDCVGMGKIMGRFTVAPVWEDEDEWVVGEEELQIPSN